MTDKSLSGGAGRVPFASLSAYYFFYYAFIGIFLPYFTLYLQSRGFSSARIGLLLALMQWMRLIAPNMWGWLADRLGRRMPILRLAAAISLAGFAIILLDDSFAGIAIAIAIMGFFWTAQSPLAEATTFSHLAGRHGYGVVRAWGSFGFIVAVLAMGWWLAQAGIEWVIYGGTGILAAVALSALLVPEAPRAQHAAGAGSLLVLLRRREILALLASCMFMTAAHGALSVFYSIHLVDVGYSKGTVGLLWTLGVLAEILVFIRAPSIMARFALRGLLVFALIVACVRFVLIGWAVGWIWLIVPLQLLHGITFGLNHIAAVSAISRWFGGIHQAQGQALYGSISAGAGGIIGSVISGCLWDWLGAGWTFTTASALALAGLLVLVTGWRKAPEQAET
ncbi:MFS transporter [Uliginosibacterium paludis]|uniref:MFS transporter n=1 Tax=Uliginosibacterium paludis TaxID=1615952 RepID=A0ABV2CKQ7_9RHOO